MAIWSAYIYCRCSTPSLFSWDSRIHVLFIEEKKEVVLKWVLLGIVDGKQGGGELGEWRTCRMSIIFFIMFLVHEVWRDFASVHSALASYIESTGTQSGLKSGIWIFHKHIISLGSLRSGVCPRFYLWAVFLAGTINLRDEVELVLKEIQWFDPFSAM